jgi:poly [ADP-ribose] polymerase
MEVERGIVKEDGLKWAKLIHVSVDNGSTAQSNKVYLMEEQSDGRIKCEYGRVGKNLTVVYKSSHEWNKVHDSKTNPRKGYKDISKMVSETTITDDTTTTTTKSTVKDIICTKTKSLFDDLMAFANKSIQKNYKVSQDSVTEAQVDAAQEVITNALGILKKGVDIKLVNNLLIELYTIIPRNMKDVRDYLLNSVDTKSELDIAKELLIGEQDTLDTMAGQVKLLKQQKDTISTTDADDAIDTDDITILEQMGLTAEEETDADQIALIIKLLGKNSNQAKKIIKVRNKKTQATFDANYKKAKVKKRRLYWHGSRNENWFNIIQTGLMIRPSGAVHTGSMFGDGIYFADKAQKSLGYSSLRGSHWTNGGSNKGYLALFDVHVGNQKEIARHDSSCYKLSQGVMKSEGFDSVFAKGGIDLRNNEFIIYDGKQCTIAYIIEMG